MVGFTDCQVLLTLTAREVSRCGCYSEGRTAKTAGLNGVNSLIKPGDGYFAVSRAT